MLNFILQIGGDVANSLDTSNVSGIQTLSDGEVTETSISLISMIQKGGPIMIPLAIMLAAVIYIIVERLLVLAKASKKNEGLIGSLKEMIHTGNISSAK